MEKLVEGAWETVWSPLIPACLSPPITIAGGATYRVDLGIFGAVPGTNVAPQFTTTDLSGTFRLVWHSLVYDYQDHLPFGEPVPQESAMSNAFGLTVRSQ
jgi:hypothetical protein